MATNIYFGKSNRSEQDLIEELSIESIKMYGHDVYYMPREVVELDIVFSDEVLARFENAYKIEMYIENTEGFDGEGDLFTKFGIEIRDAATFVVARSRWNGLIGAANNEGDPNQFYRPREGDLIFLPLSSTTFEITKVDTEMPFFALSDLPVFKLTCELFEYSNEDFDTSIVDIDKVEVAFAYQWRLVLDSAAQGYITGETVSQTLGSGAIMSGEVVRYLDSSNEIFIAHAGGNDGKWHEFITTAPLVGDLSTSSYVPTLVEELNRIHESHMNDDFAEDTATFVDFAESNPFGDINV
jgi:hypothetical protein